MNENLKNEINSLFNLNTLKLETNSLNKIKTNLIKIPKIKLNSNSIEIIEDEILFYYEEDENENNEENKNNNKNLKLNLIKGCGSDLYSTDHYIIPSLRLNYINNNEYYEPRRDRNKCWILDSQRNILNNDPNIQNEKLKLVILILYSFLYINLTPYLHYI